MWNKIQRIYIGEDLVRPTQYEYDYTFKWKTTTEIWNEWTLLVGWIYTNSDWVTWRYSPATDCRIKKDIPSLATAEKIIISFTDVVNSTDAYNAISVWLWAWTWWGTSSANMFLQWSGYSWIGVQFYNGTSYNGNNIWNATLWTYNPQLTIDLRHKTMTGVISWLWTSTLTLTDSQVSEIRQMTYLFVYVSVNLSAVSDVSIKIY